MAQITQGTKVAAICSRSVAWHNSRLSRFICDGHALHSPLSIHRRRSNNDDRNQRRRGLCNVCPLPRQSFVIECNFSHHFNPGWRISRSFISQKIWRSNCSWLTVTWWILWVLSAGKDFRTITLYYSRTISVNFNYGGDFASRRERFHRRRGRGLGANYVNYYFDNRAGDCCDGSWPLSDGTSLGTRY